MIVLRTEDREDWRLAHDLSEDHTYFLRHRTLKLSFVLEPFGWRKALRLRDYWLIFFWTDNS